MMIKRFLINDWVFSQLWCRKCVRMILYFNTIKIFQTKDTIKLLNNYNFLPQELIEKVKKL